MRYDYWTIQARPDSMRLLSFGIGVLVVDPSGRDFRLEMIDRPEAMPVNSENRDALFNMTRFVSEEFESLRSRLGGIELSRADSPRALASYMVSHWNNEVTFDRPRAVAAESLDEAADLLFDLYIGDRRAEPMVRPLTRLRRAVRSSYAAVPEVEECLHPDPQLRVGELPGEFDLAVVRADRRVFELSSSFTFTSRTVQSTRERIELWNYRVSEIRHNGGELSVGGDTVGLDRDAPIAVTFEPPNSDAQQELFDQISRQWRSHGVEAVPQSRVPAHVESVATQLRSA